MPERSSGLALAAPRSVSRAQRASSPRGNISGEWDAGTQNVAPSSCLLRLPAECRSSVLREIGVFSSLCSYGK